MRSCPISRMQPRGRESKWQHGGISVSVQWEFRRQISPATSSGSLAHSLILVQISCSNVFLQQRGKRISVNLDRCGPGTFARHMAEDEFLIELRLERESI